MSQIFEQLKEEKEMVRASFVTGLVEPVLEKVKEQVYNSEYIARCLTEGFTVRADGPITAGEMVRASFVTRLVEPVLEKVKLATDKLDTILEDIHTLKIRKKNVGQQYLTMEQIAPNWHKKITDYFTENKGTGKVNALENSQRCIMGEAFGGSRDWGYNNPDKPCQECDYLGNNALALFSNFGKHGTVSLTDSEGWNSYQARFEYHLNNDHSEIIAKHL